MDYCIHFHTSAIAQSGEDEEVPKHAKEVADAFQTLADWLNARIIDPDDDLELGGDLVVGEDLTVTEDATVEGDLDVGGDLTVTGTLEGVTVRCGLVKIHSTSPLTGSIMRGGTAMDAWDDNGGEYYTVEDDGLGCSEADTVWPGVEDSDGHWHIASHCDEWSDFADSMWSRKCGSYESVYKSYVGGVLNDETEWFYAFETDDDDASVAQPAASQFWVKIRGWLLGDTTDNDNRLRLYWIDDEADFSNGDIVWGDRPGTTLALSEVARFSYCAGVSVGVKQDDAEGESALYVEIEGGRPSGKHGICLRWNMPSPGNDDTVELRDPAGVGSGPTATYLAK